MKQQIEINRDIWEAAEAAADERGVKVNDYLLQVIREDLRKAQLERITAELSDELIADIEAIAKKEGVSVSVMVGRLIRLAMERRRLTPA